MCGIVGLLIKKKELRKSLGKMLMPMFDCMADRGPDSAGLAVYGDSVKPSLRRFSVYAPSREYDWAALGENFKAKTHAACQVTPIENHGTLVTDAPPARVQQWLREYDPALHVLSIGRNIDLYKDIGHPNDIAARYHFAELTGTHFIGHTRMATESAVTPAHSHPFTAGEDFCLVHNGSLSNPYSIRRRLEKYGIHFETDNDTEAACRFIEWRMREGDTLENAIKNSIPELDGFFTLLMATRDRLLLVRDAFACKPAVVAEHKDYIAISSEFRSLAHLPGIKSAEIYEPHPEEIYSWKV